MDNGSKKCVVAEYRQRTGPVPGSKESSIYTDRIVLYVLRNAILFISDDSTSLLELFAL